jgi:DNA gyrase subunit A
MAEDIQQRLIQHQMKESYVDYAMSVIMSRALPDVRDGLKPVHRRILYAMYKAGMHHNKPFKKSARIVGNVLGHYHPHGDIALYDAMVRLAQDFSLRYPLIDGQGNWGSQDGDKAAAHRYTEARLRKIAEELLEDIEKETVDFVPNYDNSTEEPLVLPAKLPNLLINGSSGIAVGMATNIPPHNMGEIIDGLVALIENKELNVDQLMQYVKGPDFPTGAQIIGTAGFLSAYKTGRGKIMVKGRAVVENGKIVVSDIPFMINKSTMIEDMAKLVRDGVLDGIRDIRDESDRDGMRIVIELKKNADGEIVLNQLYKHTSLKSTFSMILLSLLDKKPMVMNLKDMLLHFIDHRKTVVTRRTQFDLRKAEERSHLLAGLKIALDNIDPIVQLIKGASDVAVAREGLMQRFKLSDKQAHAVLDMKLQRLTSLESEKLRKEYEEVLVFISKCKDILGSESKIFSIVKDELVQLKQKYGDARKTEILAEEEEELSEDLIQEEDVVVTMTQAGYIKQLPLSVYREQRRGGMGVKGAVVREEDVVTQLFAMSNKHYMLLFTNKGKVHWLKAYQIPSGSRYSKGKALVNLLHLEDGERVTTVFPVGEFSVDKYLCMTTKKGIIKRVVLQVFERPRRGGIIALGLQDNDELVSVQVTNGDDVLLLATSKGNAAKFSEHDVRPMGRAAGGVRGIKLIGDDTVIGMEKVQDGHSVLTVTEKGYGKRTKQEAYRLIRRGGKGVTNIKMNERNGKVVAIKSVQDSDSVLFVTEKGIMMRSAAQDMSVIGRSTMGFRLMTLKEGDRVKNVALVAGENGKTLDEP